MYRIDRYDVTVEVDLGNGLYVFNPRSATGKSYLANVLRRYRRFGEPVNAYTFDDYLNKVTLEDATGGGSCKLLVVDRYDMYYGAYMSELLKLSKHCIVLVDVKSPSALWKNNICGILLKEGCILVS